MIKTRHFLSLLDLKPEELSGVVQRAIELKADQRKGNVYQPLKHKVLAMIFEKSSTRTRVSFETAMTHFGGNAIYLDPSSTQLGRGEIIEDTARVISRMVDVVMIRASNHDTVETFANYSEVSVINGLTDRFHPCQLLADLQTYHEHRGDIRGATVAWIGDGNNMCHSWINAARQLEFHLKIATPGNYRPNAEIFSAAASWASWCEHPQEAVASADLVMTDTWASMGQESEKEQRCRDFDGFMVDQKLMSLAKSDALFMHCLPAYRGMEVHQDVLEGSQSVVWDQAENRLHAQKALLEFLLV